MAFILLENIREVNDIKKIEKDKLPELAQEIQRRLTGCRFGSKYFYEKLSGDPQLEDVANYLLEQQL